MIKSLILNDFRNHICSKLQVADYKNIVITGLNGSGKTAVLEAVSMLGGDKGMRCEQMSNIARFDGGGGFNVSANLQDDTEISIFYKKDESNRHAKIDGDNKSLSELASILRIVYLTPKEDWIFTNSSKDRRIFFDYMITNFNPSHFGRTARLSKLLSERAAGIKLAFDKNWIDILDRQIAEISVAIAATRVGYISELGYFFKNAQISIDGKLESELLEKPAADVEKEYIKYLSENRNLVGDKMIIDGVHKSDFIVFNKILNMPVYLTSTGQQKSMLIDLIIAHAKLINVKTNKSPIILLDEFASHLDSVSIGKVVSELNLSNSQVWITGLNKEAFCDLNDVLFVTCKNGAIDNIL